MVSGRVDFSSSEMIWSKNVPTIWVNTQELNSRQEAAKSFILFRPMEFSINFDTDRMVHHIQSNLGYPNVDYPKLLGHSMTMDSSDFFLYYLLQ